MCCPQLHGFSTDMRAEVLDPCTQSGQLSHKSMRLLVLPRTVDRRRTFSAADYRFPTPAFSTADSTLKTNRLGYLRICTCDYTTRLEMVMFLAETPTDEVQKRRLGRLAFTYPCFSCSHDKRGSRKIAAAAPDRRSSRRRQLELALQLFLYGGECLHRRLLVERHI